MAVIRLNLDHGVILSQLTMVSFSHSGAERLGEKGPLPKIDDELPVRWRDGAAHMATVIQIRDRCGGPVEFYVHYNGCTWRERYSQIHHNTP